MANIGRNYERLFERDFGYRPLETFHYMQKRCIVGTTQLTPFPGIQIQGGLFISEIGVADYEQGKITYQLNFPNPGTPGANLRLEYRLSFDPAFCQCWEFLNVNGVDKVFMVRAENQVNAPFWNCHAQANYIAPFTGPITGYGHSWGPRRWIHPGP